MLFENKAGNLHYHGIYKRETNRLVICFTSAKNPRPTAFQVDKNQSVCILKPIKLPK
jgi:hypothetical protein